MEENFSEVEREAHVSLVSPSLHFLRHDGVWFVVLVCLLWYFLVCCLGNFDLIFILIPLLTDNVTHSSGNAEKKKLAACLRWNNGSHCADTQSCLSHAQRYDSAHS